MYTQQQINQFKQWARQKGYSEVQIAQEIARKQQETSKNTIQNKPATQNKPVDMPTANPNTVATNNTMSQPTSNPIGNAANAISKFVLPRVTNVFNTVTGSLDLKKNESALITANKNLNDEANKYLELSISETNPTKKRQYLKQAVELQKIAASNASNFTNKIQKFQESSKLTGKENAYEYAGLQALGVSGELATWAIPTAKMAQAAKLAQGTSVVSKIIASGIEGGIIGGIYGITTPESLSVGERVQKTITDTAIGSATGGILRAATIPLTTAANKFITSNSERIYKLFRISPSERASFRKSTEDMDFAKEILSRDAKEMAGKSYNELLDYFGQRKEQALNDVNSSLENVSSTVNRATIIKKIESMISGLKPSKGNVGQLPAIDALNKILDDVRSNPGRITMSTLNNIKRQLQDAGQAAFSPSGKATAASKAMAETSTFIKNLIEKKAPEIKDKNRLVQLYTLARNSIERTGDREANKLSNDIAQKFMQTLPAGVGAITGYGVGGAPGGFFGFLAGQMLSGTVGNMRVKYFSPEFQTKLISYLQKIAEDQGIANATQFATKAANEMKNIVIRNMSNLPTDQSAANVDVNKLSDEVSVIDTYFDENNPIDTTGLDSSTFNDQTNSQMIQIRNKKTGEVKSITKAEMGQYGLGQEKGPTIPDKKDIYVAMLADIEQTGGKNLAKLQTLMDAYDETYATDQESLQLTDTAIKNMSDLESALTDIQSLQSNIQGSDIVGPLKGILAKNPYNTEAQSLQAEIDRVRQVVGKALEGGVLRKEDEEKYKKILPVMTDTKEVATNKLNQLQQKLSEDLQRYTELQYQYKGGIDISAPTTPDTTNDVKKK